MLTINQSDTAKVIEFFTDFCRKNDIKVPEANVTADILRDVKEMYGTQQFDTIKYACRNWSMGMFKQIRKPHMLNLHFIGEMMREQQSYASGGGKLVKEKPKPQLPRREWTSDEMYPISCNNIHSGYREFKSAFYSNARPHGLFRRKMWVCYNILFNDFGYPPPTDEEQIEFWSTKVSDADRRSTNREVWSEMIRIRQRNNGKLTPEEIADNRDITRKAAIACLYFDTMENFPPLEREEYRKPNSNRLR